MSVPIISIIAIFAGLISLIVTIAIITRFFDLCSDISSIADSMKVISKHLQASKIETKEEHKEDINIDQELSVVKADRKMTSVNTIIIATMILFSIGVFILAVVS